MHACCGPGYQILLQSTPVIRSNKLKPHLPLWTPSNLQTHEGFQFVVVVGYMPLYNPTTPCTSRYPTGIAQLKETSQALKSKPAVYQALKPTNPDPSPQHLDPESEAYSIARTFITVQTWITKTCGLLLPCSVLILLLHCHCSPSCRFILLLIFSEPCQPSVDTGAGGSSISSRSRVQSSAGFGIGTSCPTKITCHVNH